MKRIFLLCMFLMCAYVMSAQKTPAGSFIILNNPNTEKQEFISQSISNSNLEPYRLQDKNVILTFENGFQVELISVTGLQNKGIQVDPASYKTGFEKLYTLPSFKMTDDGNIISKHKTLPKKEEMRDNKH